jgi:hypothetical protein
MDKQEKNTRIVNAIERLKDILTWSDRIGSDERVEIKNIIEMLNIK